MISINQYLKRDEFRFCKLQPKSKIPIESWTKNQYSYNNKSLVTHTLQGGNYGIVCGIGNLMVIDFDNRTFQNRYVKKLPNTFTVISGGKGLLHMYYTVDVPFKKIALKGINSDTVGDLQCKGSYIVGPNCIHPTTKRYVVLKHRTINFISTGYVMQLFKRYIKPIERVKADYGVLKDKSELEGIRGIVKVSDVLKRIGVNIMGRGKNVMCPFHNSKGRKNLSFDDSKGLWYCHSCQRGGTVIELMMEYKGIGFKECLEELKKW